jgi:hypothetical protein
VIDRQTRDGKPLSIDNVFVKTHLYTLTVPGGEKDFALERLLSRLEHDFARIMERKIIPMRPLTRRDRFGLAYFAAAMIARTPRQRDHIRGQWQQVLDMCDDMQRAMQTATPRQYQPLSSTLGSGGRGLSVEEVRELAAQPLQHSLLPSISGAGQILAQMSIAVLVTDASPGFITSDAPCVLYDPAAYRRPPIYRAPGLAYKTVEVSLPLTPTRLLLISWNRGFDGQYIPVDDSTVDEANRTTQSYATGKIVSCTNETRDSWFEERPVPADAWENSDQVKRIRRGRQPLPDEIPDAEQASGLEL